MDNVEISVTGHVLTIKVDLSADSDASRAQWSRNCSLMTLRWSKGDSNPRSPQD